MAYNKTLGYDPDKDYSAAMMASTSAQEKAQLQAERDKKIANMYGGKEPTLADGSGQTYTQKYGTVSSGGGSSGSGGSSNPYAGTDYHQNAINAAQAYAAGNGDWQAVLDNLNARDQKIGVTGNNYGRTSVDILNELLDTYYNPKQQQQQQLPLQIDPAPVYNAGNYDYSDRIADMSYGNWRNGDQYKALVDQYSRNGQMSMQDVMAQIASRTGGLASSYAMSAAQQKYNDFMAQLEDAAMQMYSNDKEDLYRQADYARQLEMDNYNRYLNDLSQWNTDRNFAYNQSVNDRNFAYQQQQDQLANDWREREWALSAANDDYKKQVSAAEALAGTGDYSGYGALGWTPAQIANAEEQYRVLQAAKTKSSSGGGGSSSSSGSGSRDWSALEDWVNRYGPQSATDWLNENYKSMGFSTATQAKSAWQNRQLEQGSEIAKQILAEMEIAPKQGAITEEDKAKLAKARNDGYITDKELNNILDMLGI